MSKIRLHGSSSGYTEIAPVAASGNNTLTLPNDGTIISKDSAGAIGVTSVRATNAHFSGTTRVTTGITTTSQVTGNLQFNSGYGSAATAYGCRAWIQLNQGGSQSITGSGGVSSITDEGTGTTKITFTTEMVDDNYAVVGGAQQSGDASVNYCFSLCMQSYTTVYTILIYRPTASSDVKEDNSKIHVAFFR